MLTEIADQIEQFVQASRTHVIPMLKVIGVLWAINLLDWLTGSHLKHFGIVPRTARGLIGIFLAPILHGNFTHLLFNTLPLFFLGIFIMSLSVTDFYISTVLIVLLAGAIVWGVGRKGNHIGASALIAGYFGYVLSNALFYPTIAALFCAVVAFYYFGSILLSIIPAQEDTSWEGHAAGLFSGVVAMIVCLYI